MRFRVCIYVPKAKEEGVVFVEGMDVGELGSCIVDIPADQFVNNNEMSSAQIASIANDYLAKIVKVEIIEMV